MQPTAHLFPIFGQLLVRVQGEPYLWHTACRTPGGFYFVGGICFRVSVHMIKRPNHTQTPSVSNFTNASRTPFSCFHLILGSVCLPMLQCYSKSLVAGFWCQCRHPCTSHRIAIHPFTSVPIRLIDYHVVYMVSTLLIEIICGGMRRGWRWVGIVLRVRVECFAAHDCSSHPPASTPLSGASTLSHAAMSKTMNFGAASTHLMCEL